MKRSDSRDVLFISHRSTRTGAPILLLHLLRWLRENSDSNCDVLLRKGGELESEFVATARSCYHWSPGQGKDNDRRRPDLLGENAEFEEEHRRSIVQELAAKGYHLIYANSVVCGHMLPDLCQALRAPLIVHVHELEGLITLACKEKSFEDLVSLTSRFIAVSRMVRDNLVENHGVSADRIDRIPAFVAKSTAITRDSRQIRRELGIPDDACIVGGCGRPGLRKGTDLFIAVAKRVMRLSRQPTHFVWLGGSDMESDRIQLQLEVARLGLQKIVHFAGTTAEPQDFFNAFDLFLMTSREDPFPLVCLENGRVGNPILCFDKAIGSTEYLDESCGHISPYMDVDDMAAAVIQFTTDRSRREKASRTIRERVSPYTVERCAPKILEVIDDVMTFHEIGGPGSL